MEAHGWWALVSALITVEGLHAWYDPERPVLASLSFALGAREVVGLIGLNGAGKTTLLNVLSGLHPSFTADALTFEGKPLDLRASAFKRQRYTVFAEDHAFQYFSFREYLRHVCSAYGRALPDVAALVSGFHFENYVDVLLKDLSTGNRKKAFLITAFALQPPLLLLDEPVNGLDFQSTEFLYHCINAYRAVGTVLFSSHVLESITLTADRVLVLQDGQMRQQFSADTIDAAVIREALVDDY